MSQETVFMCKCPKVYAFCKPCLFAIAAVGFAIGMISTTGLAFATMCTEESAIEHHAAHYDTQTGNFTWNEQP